MILRLAVLLGFAIWVWAQSPPVATGGAATSVRPQVVGAPLVGFFATPGARAIRAITGVGSTIALGPLFTLPTDAKRVYLPPRQRYVLIEHTGRPGLAVSSLDFAENSTGSANLSYLDGDISRPDLVAFSARGTAVAVFSRGNEIDVFSGLPAAPTVTQQMTIAAEQTLENLAVSDDGLVVAAMGTTGKVSFASKSAAWKPVAGIYDARALAFAPNTHDLAISDAARNAVLVASHVDLGVPSPLRLLTDGDPDNLCFTSDGQTLAMLDSTEGTVKLVDVNSGGTNSLASLGVSSLTLLRDGHAFLLAGTSAPLVLKVSGASATTIALNTGTDSTR